MIVLKRHFVIAVCCHLAVQMCLGEVGDVRTTIKPLGPAGQPYFCVFGLAFDGMNLYLSRCGYSFIDVIESPGDCPQAPAPCPVTRTLDPGLYRPGGIPEGVSGLAYDADQNGLWIATQAGQDRGPFGGCGSIGMPIYFWAFNDPGDGVDTVDLVYTVPLDLFNDATQEYVFDSCNMTGLAFRRNNLLQVNDDELWLVEERDYNVLKFRLDGSCPAGELNMDCATGFDARSVDSSIDRLGTTGLGTSIERLLLSTKSCEVCVPQGIEESDVFRAIEVPTGLQRVDQLVGDVVRWKADMECDPFTFSPATVIWVRTSPQGDPAKDLIVAYEIEPGSCDNVALGACCDAANGMCRNNVPQSGCAGSWEEGVDCDALSDPCLQAHMIVVLDRTGSMQAIRSETGNTRCVDAVAAADYDIKQFFANNPPGSSVAIWTFRASGPTPLTSGFVNEATALMDLHTVDTVPCSNLTPLADAVCAAVDFMVGEFPLASLETLKVAISSDGEENNSSGPCLGPPASGGMSCDEFTDGSWQRKVCDHVQGKATVMWTCTISVGSGEW